MANSLLTPTAVTRKALMILHNKLVLARNVDRQYDDRFAVNGAKIGDTLTVRLPNQYTVTTGKTLSAQDTTEQSVVITVATQKHVGMTFSTAELTMDIDDFSERIIEPAMARLASAIEQDGFALYKDVYNTVGTAGSTPASMLTMLQAGQKLDEYLAPRDDNRCLIVNPATMASMTDAYSGLFQSDSKIAKQYVEGMIRDRATGFKWGMSAVVNTHTNSAGTASNINGANQTGATLTVATTGTALAEGTVITLPGCYAVNPETKQTYSHLQQFVVGSGATTTSLPISPSITTSGALQTVSASPTDAQPIVIVGSASTGYPQMLAFHKQAFTLVTADLEDVSKYGAWGSRQTYDGISLRVARQWDVNNDNVPCRVDVLYGWKTLRPQLACRVTG